MPLEIHPERGVSEIPARRMIWLPWIFWLVVLLASIGLVFYASEPKADPVFWVNQDGIQVVLHNDLCSLTDRIGNLPHKATWQEDGKVYEGCWGLRPDVGYVIFYFEDRTVGLIPIRALRRVLGA